MKPKPVIVLYHDRAVRVIGERKLRRTSVGNRGNHRTYATKQILISFLDLKWPFQAWVNISTFNRNVRPLEKE